MDDIRKQVHDQIQHIETTYSVSSIKYDGEPLWPYLRIMVYFSLSERSSLTSTGDHSPEHRISFDNKFARLFKDCRSTNFALMFHRCDNILFTDMLETRTYNGKPIDKIANLIINQCGSCVPVVIQTPERKSAYNQFISFDLMTVFSGIRKRFVFMKQDRLSGGEVYEQIIKDYDICTYGSLQSIIRTIIATKSVYHKLFNHINPKLIFINCYYDLHKMAAIEEAKAMGITTVELQHGVIDNEHMAYNSFVTIKDNPYPDYLFCFGEKYAEHISNSIYSRNRIKIVGSYYIDLMKKAKIRNKEIFDKKYSISSEQKVITFASQTNTDNESLELMKSLADDYKDVFIIYIPRVIEDYHNNIDTDNFVIEKDLDVYQCMQNSACTMTVYSTCAIESLCFGTPVILYNYEDMAKETYKFLDGDGCDFIQMAGSIEEIKQKLDKIVYTDKEKIIRHGNRYYAGNHEDRIKIALCELGQLDENKVVDNKLIARRKYYGTKRNCPWE